MPRYQKPSNTCFGWFTQAAAAVSLLFFLWQFPWSLPLIAVIALSSWYENKKHQKQIARLVEHRPNESICNFARSFNVKAVDTWVIRAVYEELQTEIGNKGSSVPIRANDSLLIDLHIDDEDIDLSVAEAIASRTGRSLKHLDKNPLTGKINNVRDLVMFFNAQPFLQSDLAKSTLHVQSKFL